MTYTTLVDGATLQRYLGDPGWCVVDLRHQLADPGYGERAYAAAHLPGAVFLHLDRDLSGPLTGKNGRHPLPDPQRLIARLGELGIGNDTQVVVYDDAQGMIAGRLWWLLRWLGHDRVAFLDGGFALWQAEGRPLTAEAPARPPAVFSGRVQGGTVDADWLLAHLGAPDLCLIDARGPDRFRGENETIDPVGGHIPGARNRFFKDNLEADGRFKPAALLRSEYLALLAGNAPDQVVMQCGSGVSACLNLLAMEIAGLHGAKLYPGSWSEWCSDPARPVA
ncbi:sulfurtransferase [Azospira restricta]|uniref:Sulfurtransferase n=1 Tax=Azospira restricta TaxID=404405 RepID=A0A974SND7_9RHOO|nr:sulfurtransferase [Azospira restricta]QRJ63442.1 sulfurtransferase [Azospira restricta]